MNNTSHTTSYTYKHGEKSPTTAPISSETTETISQQEPAAELNSTARWKLSVDQTLIADRNHYNSAVKTSNEEKVLVTDESTILQISADGPLSNNRNAMVGLEHFDQVPAAGMTRESSSGFFHKNRT